MFKKIRWRKNYRQFIFYAKELSIAREKEDKNLLQIKCLYEKTLNHGNNVLDIYKEIHPNELNHLNIVMLRELRDNTKTLYNMFLIENDIKPIGGLTKKILEK